MEMSNSKHLPIQDLLAWDLPTCREQYRLRAALDQMVGNLYPSIVCDEMAAIQTQMERLALVQDRMDAYRQACKEHNHPAFISARCFECEYEFTKDGIPAYNTTSCPRCHRAYND